MHEVHRVDHAILTWLLYAFSLFMQGVERFFLLFFLIIILLFFFYVVFCSMVFNGFLSF